MTQILIVEDYPSLQRIYKTILEHEGYQVKLASDGQEALNEVAGYEPDLILLDLLMAKVDGLEFLRHYKAQDHPKTKIVVFSNLASPELSQEAKALGASRYLTKSQISPKELVHVVKETLATTP